MPGLDYAREHVAVAQLREALPEEAVGHTNHLAEEAPLIRMRAQCLELHALDHCHSFVVSYQLSAVSYQLIADG